MIALGRFMRAVDLVLGADYCRRAIGADCRLRSVENRRDVRARRLSESAFKIVQRDFILAQVAFENLEGDRSLVSLVSITGAAGAAFSLASPRSASTRSSSSPSGSTLFRSSSDTMPLIRSIVFRIIVTAGAVTGLPSRKRLMTSSAGMGKMLEARQAEEIRKCP